MSCNKVVPGRPGRQSERVEAPGRRGLATSNGRAEAGFARRSALAGRRGLATSNGRAEAGFARRSALAGGYGNPLRVPI